MRTPILGVSISIIYITLLATLWPSGSMKEPSVTWKCIKVVLDVKDGQVKFFLFQRLADHVDGVLPNDLFFDRLVYIHHEGQYDFVTNRTTENVKVEDLSVTLNGAIISERLVLTSWNPFRNIIRFRFKRYFTHICVTWKRRYDGEFESNRARYKIHEYNIDCARPVIPLRDDDVPIDLWHGYLNDPKMHSPIHDLVVFRSDTPFFDLSKVQLIMTTEYWRNEPRLTVVGPIMTFLANETDALGREMKFAMLGNNLSKEMVVRRNIYVRTYEAEENVVTDCDEWIPREWGWFICLRNLDDIPRLASGAMLYHNDLLYGVGSFSLWKGNQSILVFTDVRKYKDLILNTCTEEDQNLAPPKE